MSVIGEPHRIGNQMVVFMLRDSSVHITDHGNPLGTTANIDQSGMNPFQDRFASVLPACGERDYCECRLSTRLIETRPISTRLPGDGGLARYDSMNVGEFVSPDEAPTGPGL